MKEGLWKDWLENSIYWSGWVFTVGGAIIGLLIVNEFVWLGILFFLAAYLSLFALFVQKHRQLALVQNAADAATLKAIEAERRLNAIPADLLDRLNETIRRHSFTSVARLLGEYAAFIERMRNLIATDDKPIKVRSFVRRDGNLYAVAGITKDAQACLLEDDVFALMYKDATGLVTRSAHLLVHQKDDSKELVWFRVERFVGDEMASLTAFADKQDVPAKGYFAQVDAELTQFSGLNSAPIADLLRRFADELARQQG